ncbi:MAG: FAD-binding oxidoreductase [Chloroflexi bacterium]|nr:FAD-binding oxidoreductase [Chloroflexota bacterium]
MSMTSVEIAVVGSGVTGSSIAYHLARAGAQVHVFEQAAPALEPSASWASAGGVRQQGRDPREWPLTLEAARRWPLLDDELAGTTGFVQGGHVHVVEQSDDLAVLEARVAHERAAGMDIRMLDAAELYALAPVVRAGALGGAYTPADGQANPPSTTRAFAAAAERLGARIITGARVECLLVQQQRVTGLMVNGERMTARWVVLASGVWTPRLATPIGLHLPIRVRAPQMVLTTPGPARLAPTITAAGRPLSLKQLPSGEFFIGGGWPADVQDDGERLSCQVRDDSVRGSWAVASEIVPVVSEQRIERSWCGLEAQAFDGTPLIGPAPEFEGLYLSVGFSGHGFQIAPAVGRTVADALSGKGTPELEGLAPNRMLTFDPVEVAAFMTDTTSALGAGLRG